jgi:hypothetical protein
MILRQHLVAWRSRSWSDLRAMIGEAQVLEADGPSGTRYTVEVEASWDGKPEGDIRALASIDDGGWVPSRPCARTSSRRGVTTLWTSRAASNLRLQRPAVAAIVAGAAAVVVPSNAAAAEPPSRSAAEATRGVFVHLN